VPKCDGDHIRFRVIVAGFALEPTRCASVLEERTMIRVFPNRPGPLATRFAATALGLWRSLSDPYRPELHYMRGPGPKWRARHAAALEARRVG
jgi:hypothetical protein